MINDPSTALNFSQYLTLFNRCPPPLQVPWRTSPSTSSTHASSSPPRTPQPTATLPELRVGVWLGNSAVRERHINTVLTLSTNGISQTPTMALLACLLYERRLHQNKADRGRVGVCCCGSLHVWGCCAGLDSVGHRLFHLVFSHEPRHSLCCSLFVLPATFLPATLLVSSFIELLSSFPPPFRLLLQQAWWAMSTFTTTPATA